MMKRRARNPYAWTTVRLPERPLADAILHLAAPLLEPLGPTPALAELRRALEVTIDLWNAHVLAASHWASPAPRALAALRKSMCGKQAPPGLADTFQRLSARWRAEFPFDPRLVGEWSLREADGGRHELVCETTLPEGVREEVLPHAEKRIAIGGRFLDEVRIRQSETSSLVFPAERHRAEVGGDGSATIHAMMPSILQLFAEGVLTPVGGEPVELVVGGRRLGPMVLAEVRCSGGAGPDPFAELVFRKAKAPAMPD